MRAATMASTWAGDGRHPRRGQPTPRATADPTCREHAQGRQPQTGTAGAQTHKVVQKRTMPVYGQGVGRFVRGYKRICKWQEGRAGKGCRGKDEGNRERGPLGPTSDTTAWNMVRSARQRTFTSIKRQGKELARGTEARCAHRARVETVPYLKKHTRPTSQITSTKPRAAVEAVEAATDCCPPNICNTQLMVQ